MTLDPVEVDKEKWEKVSRVPYNSGPSNFTFGSFALPHQRFVQTLSMIFAVGVEQRQGPRPIHHPHYHDLPLKLHTPK